jgi:hypothetical protein
MFRKITSDKNVPNCLYFYDMFRLIWLAIISVHKREIIFLIALYCYLSMANQISRNNRDIDDICVRLG